MGDPITRRLRLGMGRIGITGLLATAEIVAPMLKPRASWLHLRAGQRSLSFPGRAVNAHHKKRLDESPFGSFQCERKFIPGIFANFRAKTWGPG